MLSRYLDPRNDIAFKKVFGSEKHKNIPIDFLNAVLNLQGDHTIIDLTFLETNQKPKVASRKQSVVDVLVQDQGGCKYVVEMQVAKVEGFEKRAQYYAAKTYCSHFKVGENYVDLKKVVFLAIADYVVFPKKENQYKSDHVILDQKTYEHDLKDFSFTFVELPKFTKGLHELETIEDKWYYFLKYAENDGEIKEILSKNEAIKEAYTVLDSHYWNEEELRRYEKAGMAIADERGRLMAAVKEGEEKGRKEGLEEGLKKGKEEGLKEGKIQIAQDMLKNNFPIDQVMQYTGLSKEEITTLYTSVVAE